MLPSTEMPIPKPVKRRRWLYVVLAMLVLLIGVPAGWFVWSRVSMKNDWAAAVAEAEADLPRWTLMEMEEDRPPVPPAENSALFIIALTPKIRPANISGAPNYELIFEKLPPNVRLNMQQTQLIRAGFARIGPARAEARKIKDMPRGRFPIKYSDDFIGTLIPNHQDARTTCDLLKHDAMLLAEDAEYDRALEACQACLSLGGSMRDDLFLISMLIRVAMNNIAAESLERVLAQGDAFDERTLAAMQAALQRETKIDQFLAAVRGERAGIHHLFDNARTGKINLKAFGGMRMLSGLAGTSYQPSFGDRLAEVFPSLLLRQYPDHLKEMNRCVEICKLPIHERTAKLEAWEMDIKQSKNVLTRLLAPALAKVHQADCRHQAFLKCAAVAVACERYRLKHKDWPATLETLVQAKLIDAIPADPIDGQPLRFRRTKEGVVIYSIGIDKKDDGGHINRARPQDSGVDLGFRLWDPAFRRQPPRPPVGLPEVQP